MMAFFTVALMPLLADRSPALPLTTPGEADAVPVAVWAADREAVEEDGVDPAAYWALMRSAPFSAIPYADDIRWEDT